ncbi:hypothetical protein AMTRI_Chr11g101010 [Amborella trichopoda]
MPLFKRKPFSLMEPPQDLEPHELVFQIRFTKELFRFYENYLRRINLYRQRVWTCKVTGKTKLTYEEALISEQNATKKVQQFHKELMEPVLLMVQFSTLGLNDLVKTISKRLQEPLVEGQELNGKKGEAIHPCRILKVFEKAENGSTRKSYEVGWLDKDNKVTDRSVEDAESLIWKKQPVSRDLIKAFIRESTSRSAPWMVHETLAMEYGIPTKPPEELIGKRSLQNEHQNCIKKEKTDVRDGSLGKKKRLKEEPENSKVLQEIKAKTAQKFNVERERTVKVKNSIQEGKDGKADFAEEKKPRVYKRKRINEKSESLEGLQNSKNEETKPGKEEKERMKEENENIEGLQKVKNEKKKPKVEKKKGKKDDGDNPEGSQKIKNEEKKLKGENKKRIKEESENAEGFQISMKKDEKKPKVKKNRIRKENQIPEGSKEKKKLKTEEKKTNVEVKMSEENEYSNGLPKQAKFIERKAIKYPIEDLLVQPDEDGPVFIDQPTPTRDFAVPMHCVGDLLTVWDFCSSFNRSLRLWPFTLEDFENAIMHQESNPSIIVEAHSSILHLLIEEKREYYSMVQKRRRKAKMTSMNWSEYLYDFLEMENGPKFTQQAETIKRGHYCALSVHDKLQILHELVDHALTTDAIRSQLDKYIEQQQSLAASQREEFKKRREVIQELQKQLKAGSETKEGLRNDDCNGKIDKLNKQNGEREIPNGFELKHANGHIRNGLEGNERGISASNDQDLQGGPADDEKRDSTQMEEQQVQNKEKVKAKKKEEQKLIEQTAHFEREKEKRFIRTNPLGKDRNYNRYWFFRREGKIFVESSDFNQWGYYTSKEELDRLMGSLNPKGERERALQRQLQKRYWRICAALAKRSREIAYRIAREEATLRRSTRVRTQPKDRQGLSFLRYVNKWRDD